MITTSTNPSPMAGAEATGDMPTTDSTQQVKPAAAKRSPRTARRIQTAANGTVASEELAASSPTVEGEMAPTEPAAVGPIPVVEAPQAVSAPRRQSRARVMRAGAAPKAVRRTAGPKRLKFRVTFTAKETLTARTVLDALQQAEARGATDVRSITRVS